MDSIAAAGDSRPPRILIIDDTPTNIKVLESVLKTQGYQLISASNGQEGLDRAMMAQPDLVLLDILMPGIDGYEVCSRLRANPSTENLPVVMITASGEQQRVRALEVGADDFIQKPFNQAELLARVRSLLRIKAYQDKNREQADKLARWNKTLEQRVAEQVQ